MDFDTIARVSAEWAPPIFGLTVALLTAANVYVTSARMFRLRKAHFLLARLKERQDGLPAIESTRVKLDEILSKADAMEENLLARLQHEPEAKAEIELELEELASVKKLAYQNRVDSYELDAEKEKIDVRIREMQEFLAELGPRPTLGSKIVNQLLGAIIWQVAEYVGNVTPGRRRYHRVRGPRSGRK